MRPMCPVWLPIGVVLALGLGGGRLGAAPPEASPAAAQERAIEAALAAFRSNDDAALLAAQDAFDGDPVALAVALLLRRAEGEVAAPRRDADALEAAARLARLTSASERARSLEVRVAAWSGWDGAAWAVEIAHDALRVKAQSTGLTAAQVASLERGSQSPHATRALLAHAMRLRRSGAEADAVVALERAVAAADAFPWPLLALRGRCELAQALLLREAHERALEVAARGLTDAELLGSPASVGVLQRARAGALLGLDRPDEALEAIEQAYAGRPGAWSVSVESQRAGILSALGRRAEAVAVGERVVEALQGEGDAYVTATALNNLASYEAREGRLARAITLTERAIEALQRVPQSDQVRRLRATAAHNMAMAQRNLGAPAQALAGFEVAERMRRDLGLEAAADRSASQHASALVTLGRAEEALARLSALAERARMRRRPVAEAYADARIVLLLGRQGQAEAARAHALDALRRAQAAGLPPRFVDELELALAGVGVEPGSALARLDAYLATRGTALGPYTRAISEAFRARLLASLGRYPEAAAASRRALDGRRARSVGLGDHDMGLGGGASGAGVTLALDVARKRLAQAGDAAARRDALDDVLHASEAWRAIRLQDGLANRGALLAARAPPGVVREERDLRRALDAALAAAGRLGPASAPSEAVAARARTAAAETAWSQAAARLRRELRFGAELVASPPTTLEDLVRALGARRTYVAYERAGEELVALVVEGRGAGGDEGAEPARLVELGPAAPIVERAAAWLDRLASGADDRALAVALYDALLRPVEASLREDGVLLIAPEPSLARLPFAALLRSETRAPGEVGTAPPPRRLVERVACVLVPSATTWMLLGQEAQATPRGRGLLAVGRPRALPGAALPDLPASETEARRVAALAPEGEGALLLGAEATRAAFLAAAATPRAVAPARWAALHFAGHAVMDLERPNLSSLLLADGERLGLDDLSEGGVQADLAVLSACETALAHDALAEGASGFPRRLFLAGCPRVVVTAWPVIDGAGTELLADFHARRLGAATPAGSAPSGSMPTALMPTALMPTALALATAQRARAKAGDPPSAWASFLLWGLDD